MITMATTMDNRNCPKHRPHPAPVPPPPFHCDVEDKIMANINRKFATNDAVARLANELRKTNDNINIKATEAATAAAGMVLRQVRTDLDNLDAKIDEKKEFNVKIVASVPGSNTPLVNEPDFSTLYLTRATAAEANNQWEEWLAIPDPTSVEGFTWEHIGAKTIDLTWINQNFDSINEQIHKLQCRMGKFSREVANAILERAVKPLNELKAYLKSQEFMQFLTSQAGIPLANGMRNGLMSSQSYALLYAISNWITYNTEIEGLGGGSYGANEVNQLWSQS